MDNIPDIIVATPYAEIPVKRVELNQSCVQIVCK